jgi:hypothetical protein
MKSKIVLASAKISAEQSSTTIDINVPGTKKNSESNNIHLGMPNIVKVLPCLVMHILKCSWKIIGSQLIPGPIPISLP